MVCAVNKKFTGSNTECDPQIANCDICLSKKCIHCEENYYLHDNSCVKSCPKNYQVYRGVCVKIINNCNKFRVKKVPTVATIDSKTV